MPARLLSVGNFFQPESRVRETISWGEIPAKGKFSRLARGGAKDFFAVAEMSHFLVGSGYCGRNVTFSRLAWVAGAETVAEMSH